MQDYINMNTSNTQLTTASGYSTKRMIFSEPVVGTIPNTPISYKRINISTKNEDGTVGDLILSTEELFSFGVSENKDFNDPTKVNGHVLPLCLWDRDGPTEAQKEWIETFNAIIERCKKHLLQHKEEIGQYELSASDLKKLNPLYWKKEKGKIVEGRGPALYGKLIASKKLGKILTSFYDENDEKLEPLDLLGKYCFAKCAIKIESIFIGSKISMQIKVYEATVRLQESGMQRLLPRPKGKSRMLTAESANLMSVDVDSDAESDNNADANSDANSDNDSDSGSIGVASDNEEPEPEPEPVKVEKKVKKIKKVKKGKKAE